MPLKTINAIEIKVGSYIIIDGLSCVVKNIDVSKTGKHGASKVRVEAVGIINGQKKIAVMPGHDKVEVPFVEKRKAQILAMNNEKANVMDIESFETFDIDIDEEARGIVKEGDNVEYWNVEGEKIIKRKV
ncbi:MAG: translation initiation factor IF-5A [Nanoarchaeota archaeon]